MFSQCYARIRINPHKQGGTIRVNGLQRSTRVFQVDVASRRNRLVDRWCTEAGALVQAQQYDLKAEP